MHTPMHLALPLFLAGAGLVCLAASATSVGLVLLVAAPVSWIALR